MDFDGTTRGPVRAQALGAAEKKAKRPAGSGEDGPGRTFEAGGGLREKVVCRGHGQQVPASRSRHRQLTGQHGREARMGMAMIPMEGLGARIVRRWFVVMHVMTKVLAMYGQHQYAGVISPF